MGMCHNDCFDVVPYVTYVLVVHDRDIVYTVLLFAISVHILLLVGYEWIMCDGGLWYVVCRLLLGRCVVVL